MKKIIKIVLLLFFLACLFAAGSVFLLSKFVKPEFFKEQLAKAFALRTGREVTIQGSMGVTVFPKFSAVIRDVTLSNAKYFTNQPFAHARKIEIPVEILPLFTGKVKIGKFIFQDFTMNLQRKSSGINNWSDLLGHEEPAEATTDQDKSLPELYIANISFENADINYDDFLLGRHIKLSHLNLDGRGLNLSGSSFYVHAQGNVVSSEPKIDSTFTYEGNMVLDLPNKIYAAKGLKLAGNLMSTQLQQRVDFAIGADVNVDISKQDIVIDNLRLQLANAVAVGKMHATNIIYAPDVVGDIWVDTFDPKPLLRAFGVIPNVIANEQSQQSAEQQAWQSASLQATIQTTSKFLKVPKLELRLNDSILTGSASYSHFNDKLVVFDFDIDHLNLDRYKMEPSPQADAAKTTKEATSKVSHKLWQRSHKNKVPSGESNTAKLPAKKVEWLPILRQYILNGDVHIGDLQLANMHFKDINMQVGGDSGDIDVSPFNCKFYQGSVSGALSIDLRQAMAKFNLTANAANVAMKSLLQDAISNNKLTGTAALKAKLTTVGNSINLLLKNLRGNSSLRITNGTFYGVDIRYQIEKVKAMIKGKDLQEQESQPAHTAFNQLNANFNIANGVAHTNDLLLQSAYFKVTGKGNADLLTQNLDMQLDASYADHSDFYVPIKVTGAFSSPVIRPDVAVFMGHLLKEAVEQQIGKQLKGAGKDGKIDASKLIKSIKIDGKDLGNFLK